MQTQKYTSLYTNIVHKALPGTLNNFLGGGLNITDTNTHYKQIQIYKSTNKQLETKNTNIYNAVLLPRTLLSKTACLLTLITDATTHCNFKLKLMFNSDATTNRNFNSDATTEDN